MKKVTLCSLQLVFSIILSERSFSQPIATGSEKFDIISYTPPEGWQKDVKQSFVSHITVNQSKGTFCLIALYAAVPGTATPTEGFAKEWNDLVVTPYHAEKNPKTEMRTNAEGWKVISGAAAVQRDNISSYIMLSVAADLAKQFPYLPT